LLHNFFYGTHSRSSDLSCLAIEGAVVLRALNEIVAYKSLRKMHVLGVQRPSVAKYSSSELRLIA
jgi:hypothetical protein